MTMSEKADWYQRVSDKLRDATRARSSTGRPPEFRDTQEFREVMIETIEGLIRTKKGRSPSEEEVAEKLSETRRGKNDGRASDDKAWYGRDISRWCNQVYGVPYSYLVAQARARIDGASK